MEIGLGSRACVEARECTDVGVVVQYLLEAGAQILNGVAAICI